MNREIEIGSIWRSHEGDKYIVEAVKDLENRKQLVILSSVTDVKDNSFVTKKIVQMIKIKSEDFLNVFSSKSWN